MRKIQWIVLLDENNDQIASVENSTGFPSDKMESHLVILGLLENLKQKHLDAMKQLRKVVKKGNDEPKEE